METQALAEDRPTVEIVVVGISAVTGLMAGALLVPVVRRATAGSAPVTPIRPAARDLALVAVTAATWTALALRFGPSWSLPPELVFTAGFVALGTIDLEHHLLPRHLVRTTLVLGGASLVGSAALTGRWGRLGVALLVAAVLVVLFTGLHLARPAWLGFGDVRLAAPLALAVGWAGGTDLIVAFVVANLLAAAVAVILLAAGRATRSTALPYGTFLVAGALIALVAGGALAGGYERLLA